MANASSLNVYSGPQALQNYFDPDSQPMLPLVELPAKLNPFLDDGVHIFAKMLTALPAQNVKALPALNMIQNAHVAAKKPVVEASSGSTVISLALGCRVMNQNDDVTAYVTNKTEISRLQTLAFFGIKVKLYGGPAQPAISDERGIINKIRRQAEAEGSGIWAPMQYENENNYKSHIRWTGPQLLKQLPDISIFCSGMGSAGCVTGTGLYLKEHKPTVKIIGVCNRTGDPIPGPRPAPMFESIDFPWETVVDEVQEVDSPQSYRMSMLLSREGLICGPSSGMALQALLNVLRKAKVEGRLGEFAAADGQVRAVFTCCDLPYQYMDNYARKLGPSAFEPIGNVHLLDIDTHPYDAAWELEATAAVEWLHKTAKFASSETLSEKVVAVPDVKVVDIRAPADFAKEALFGAQNVPFDSVKAGIASPFDDVAVLEDQWTEMKELVGPEPAGHELTEGGGPFLVVCYDGESSRVFTSILRARGAEVYSIKGGFPSLKAAWRHGSGRI